MIKNISVLITGRGNNTLKDKNIIEVLGRPLLQYGALQGKKVKRATSFFVSSEDDKILMSAEQCGYTSIKRPIKYAQPNSLHVDCLVHAVNTMKEKYMIFPDILLVILANSATIKSEWMNDCIDILLENPDATAAIPVQKNNDHHPLRAKKLDENGLLVPFVDADEDFKNISSNRQDLPSNFFVCHNFWALNLKNMKQDFSFGHPPWPFMGDKVMPYEVDYSIDVHNIEDLYLTEAWLKKHGEKNY